MAKFRFKALDSQGKEVFSTVEAESQSAAIEKIRGMKLTPKAIGLVKEDAAEAAPAEAGALAAVLEEAPQAESAPATAQIPETARN